MVARAVEKLDLSGARLLFIENVGNLVCPASFDLGEKLRVVLLSAAEGEDKPLKYPPIFKSAHVVLLTKIDVAAVLGFDRAAAAESGGRGRWGGSPGGRSSSICPGAAATGSSGCTPCWPPCPRGGDRMVPRRPS